MIGGFSIWALRCWWFSVAAFGAELLCRQHLPASVAFPLPPISVRKAVVWPDSGSQCSLSQTTDADNCRWKAIVTDDVRWRVQATLQGHGGAACAVAWAPDGSQVVVGNADGSADVWQYNSSKAGWERRTKLNGHTDAVRAVSFSPDSSAVITADAASSVRLWSPPLVAAAEGVMDNRTASNASEPLRLRTMDAHLRVASDGANGSNESSASLIEGNNASNSTSNASPDEDRSRLIVIEDLERPYGPRWRMTSILRSAPDAIWAVTWPEQGSRVLAGGQDRTACLRGPPEESRRSMAADGGESLWIEACPGDRAKDTTVLRNSYDRIARFWHGAMYNERRHRWSIEARLQDRHRHGHVVLDVAISPNGEKVLTGSNDGVGRIWHAGAAPPAGLQIGADNTQWELVAMLKAHVREIWSVAWAPDGGHLLTASRDGVVHVWRPNQSMELLQELRVDYDLGKANRTSAPSGESLESENGTSVNLTNATHSIELSSKRQADQWEVAATLQEIKCTFTADDVIESVFYGGLNVTAWVEGDLQDWQKDKTLVLSAVPGAYLVVAIRNLEPKACHTGGVAMVCSNGIGTATVDVHLGWEAIGSQVPFSEEHLTGGGSGWSRPCKSTSRFYLPAERYAMKLGATDDPYSVFRIRLATQAARGLAAFGDRVARSGAFVGLTSAGNQEHVKDEGSLQRSFVETPPPVGVNAFRPEGESGHPPAAWVAAWSPDGRKVILGSRDGTARVWRLIRVEEPQQWRLEATLTGHHGVVWSASWSPDGRQVATAGEDGLVRVWTV
eukprot:TRINITY_DN29374_c0_g2_i1.p1 TRINITY_DN29374_c0_g2~~TRINITY_DN29374_c0_g2_i1.p1  ORF type:complete len:788 (+),score=110.57 TRINITY_DN29374_c0_g2_i1:194-2557(+)